ncbi:unnamed protein product, partial [Ectocarpus sp. 6 AP-2014]
MKHQSDAPAPAPAATRSFSIPSTLGPQPSRPGCRCITFAHCSNTKARLPPDPARSFYGIDAEKFSPQGERRGREKDGRQGVYLLLYFYLLLPSFVYLRLHSLSVSSFLA